MRYANIGASNVPDSALGAVILDSGVPDLQRGEVTVSRDTTKKAEPKTPHLLSLNQYIVAWSQEEKCELKYVIQLSGSGLSDRECVI
jgi:hypothetical protein